MQKVSVLSINDFNNLFMKKKSFIFESFVILHTPLYYFIFVTFFFNFFFCLRSYLSCREFKCNMTRKNCQNFELLKRQLWLGAQWKTGVSPKRGIYQNHTYSGTSRKCNLLWILTSLLYCRVLRWILNNSKEKVCSGINLGAIYPTWGQETPLLNAGPQHFLQNGLTSLTFDKMCLWAVPTRDIDSQ